jgi:hypothetical protein
MIQLSASAIAAHPLMSLLKTPPTHAKLVGHRYIRPLDGVLVGSALIGSMIEAIYAFGTLDANSNFVPSTVVQALTTALGTTSPSSSSSSSTIGGTVVAASASMDGIDANERHAAVTNLVGAGVVPTPGTPHVPLTVASKKAGDFKECDLDAVISVYNPQLEGTVV